MIKEGKKGDGSGYLDALFPIGIVGIVLVVIVPLPPFLLDILLSLSIVLSVMTLLLTLYVERPLEFSAFPSLLLIFTLYRLGVSIASTRMILSDGRAGDIIHTFGDFVIQGNCLVGLVLFSLITLINFIVVTKGAGRIAEVSARFTLEALPGKQMAIENELSSGLISQQEAKVAREVISQEAEFFGAMDGASKFVRGDAIASIVMVFINLLGGMCVGMGVKHLSFGECLLTFTQLTVGDGLVCQIPALLVSLGAGMMVTRASKGSIGKSLPKQLFTHPKILWFAGGVLLLLGLLPGMPFVVMGPMAIAFAFCGYRLQKKKKTADLLLDGKSSGEAVHKPHHPIELQLGVNLLAMAEPLGKKMAQLRISILQKWGVNIPSIHICDQSRLPPKGYSIEIKGIVVASGRLETIGALYEALYLAIESHLADLINRQEIVHLLNEAKKEDAALVDELMSGKLKPGQILRVLQNLLKERVPIRDFTTILELIVDHLPQNKEVDIDQLTESVRQGLARGISQHFFGEKKVAHAIMLDPKVEQTLKAAWQEGKLGGSSLLLRPSTAKNICENVALLLNRASVQEGAQPVVLIHSSTRRSMRHLLEKELPHLPVLSFEEVISEIEIQSVGTVSTEVLIG